METYPTACVFLNRLVADFCPNGGIGMLYTTNPPCRTFCPLRAFCVQIHHQRMQRARIAAMVAKVEGRN